MSVTDFALVKPSAAAAVLQSPFITVCPFQLLQLLKAMIGLVSRFFEVN